MIDIVRQLVRRRATEQCVVCQKAIKGDQTPMRLPGGGQVHRECSTYRMRRDARARRAMRARPGA